MPLVTISALFFFNALTLLVGWQKKNHLTLNTTISKHSLPEHVEGENCKSGRHKNSRQNRG